MDLDVERKFVNSFVLKHKRERVLFELQHDKKRWQCVGHLRLYLMPEFVHVIPSVSTVNDITQVLEKLGVGRNMYLLMSEQDKSGFIDIQRGVTALASIGKLGFAYSKEADVAFFVDEEYEKVVLYH